MNTVDVLAIGAHPDDVELGCGGTLALLAEAGRSVGLLHLTRGEAGTRGSAEQRQAEATGAAEALGASCVEFLDFGDGCLRTGPTEEDELIQVLRRLRPELVLAPTAQDRHPDHGRAHRLVVDACFYSGLRKRGSEQAHRPAAVFSYLQHDIALPSFVVDVSAVWERKMAALDAYESQIYKGGPAEGKSSEDNTSDGNHSDGGGEPQTKISSPMFRASIEARARHFGLQIGVEYGEPFFHDGPVAVANPWDLLPRGLR